MIEVVKKVVRALEHGHFMGCGIDTLIRIDEKNGLLIARIVLLET